MPLPVKKKYGISFLQVPLFAQQFGIFSTQKFSSLEFKSFLILLQKKFKLVSNYPFNTINYEEFEKEFEEVFNKKEKDTLKKYKTHHLSLQQNYLKIRQNYNRNTKHKINQSQKQNFEVLKGNNIDLVYTFFEKNVFLENGISNQAKPILKALFKILKGKGLAELYYIQNNKQEILSGILFAKSESSYKTNAQVSNQNHSVKKWIYLFNAANSNNKKNESRRWFLDKFIQEKSNPESQSTNNSIQILDFESAQAKEVARFDASFGSEEKSFFIVDYDKLPFYIKIVQKASHLIIQSIKG